MLVSNSPRSVILSETKWSRSIFPVTEIGYAEDSSTSLPAATPLRMTQECNVSTSLNDNLAVHSGVHSTFFLYAGDRWGGVE